MKNRKQVVPEMLLNRKMLDINIKKHFYNYVLDITDTKTHKSKQFASKKTHKHICLIKLTTKPYKLFELQKSLITLTLLKICPIIY